MVASRPVQAVAGATSQSIQTGSFFHCLPRLALPSVPDVPVNIVAETAYRSHFPTLAEAVHIEVAPADAVRVEATRAEATPAEATPAEATLAEATPAEATWAAAKTAPVEVASANHLHTAAKTTPTAAVPAINLHRRAVAVFLERAVDRRDFPYELPVDYAGGNVEIGENVATETTAPQADAGVGAGAEPSQFALQIPIPPGFSPDQLAEAVRLLGGTASYGPALPLPAEPPALDASLNTSDGYDDRNYRDLPSNKVSQAELWRRLFESEKRVHEREELQVAADINSSLLDINLQLVDQLESTSADLQGRLDFVTSAHLALLQGRKQHTAEAETQTDVPRLADPSDVALQFWRELEEAAGCSLGEPAPTSPGTGVTGFKRRHSKKMRGRSASIAMYTTAASSSGSNRATDANRGAQTHGAPLAVSGVISRNSGTYGLILRADGTETFVLPSSCEAFDRIIPPLGTKVWFVSVLFVAEGKEKTSNVVPFVDGDGEQVPPHRPPQAFYHKDCRERALALLDGGRPTSDPSLIVGVRPSVSDEDYQLADGHVLRLSKRFCLRYILSPGGALAQWLVDLLTGTEPSEPSIGRALAALPQFILVHEFQQLLKLDRHSDTGVPSPIVLQRISDYRLVGTDQVEPAEDAPDRSRSPRRGPTVITIAESETEADQNRSPRRGAAVVSKAETGVQTDAGVGASSSSSSDNIAQKPKIHDLRPVAINVVTKAGGEPTRPNCRVVAMAASKKIIVRLDQLSIPQACRIAVLARERITAGDDSETVLKLGDYYISRPLEIPSIAYKLSLESQSIAKSLFRGQPRDLARLDELLVALQQQAIENEDAVSLLTQLLSIETDLGEVHIGDLVFSSGIVEWALQVLSDQ